jgi:lysophospholipase L1-like esterase
MRYNRRVQIQSGRWSILLLMPFFVSACASPPRGLIILCAGDSITAEAYPHFLQQLFNREGPRAKVLNYGRSGHTSGEYLSYLIRNRERVAAERPDFILLELGTNDVRADGDFTPAERFSSQMKEILGIFRTFRSRGGTPPRIFLATVPPVPQGTPFPFTDESVRRVANEINPRIEALARAEDVPLVDFYRLFLEDSSLLSGVHPTRDGYRSMARRWRDALAPFLAK